jgi:hypothetical protein
MDEKNVKAFNVFKRVLWLFSFFGATIKYEKPLLLSDDGDDCFVLEGVKQVQVFLLDQIYNGGEVTRSYRTPRSYFPSKEFCHAI